MSILRFTGFSIEPSSDRPLRSLVGFAVESLENFQITVVDGFGQLVFDADVEVTFGGTTQVYNTGATGAVTLYFPSPVSSIKVSASKDCLSSIDYFTQFPGPPLVVVIQELPCLTSTVINEYNLVRWRRADGLQLPFTSEPSMCSDCDTHNNFSAAKYPSELIKLESCSPSLILAGESYRTAINTRLSVPVQGFQNLTIGLLDGSYNTVFSSIGSVTVSSPDTNGNVYIYADWSVSTVVNRAFYYLVIYDSSTNIVYFVSNQLQGTNDTQNTSFIEWSAPGDNFGFEFETMGDTRPSTRLILNALTPEYPTETDSYQSSATGSVITNDYTQQKTIPWQSRHINDKARDALQAWSTMSALVINGTEYKPVPGLEVDEGSENNALKICRINTSEQDFARVNYFN